MRYITQQVLFLLVAFTVSGSLSAQWYAPFRFEHDGRTVDMMTLMRETNTPDLSVALDYGDGDTTFTASTNERKLANDVLFPVGAASSAPMIVLVLQLMEKGDVNLDDPINLHLTSITVPTNKGKEITIRDLLLMKPKLGSGYKPEGYGPGEARPTLARQAAALKPRGVRKVDQGTEHGGWILLQLMLEDIHGADLQTIADRDIFTPLCLESMLYASELPREFSDRMVGGHRANGRALPGSYKRYVATGGHGLWTTPLDYVRFVRAILDIGEGKENSVLRPETVRMAMERAYGHRSLLFHLSDSGMPFWGGNAFGYYFTMQVNPEKNWISAVALNRQLNWQLGSPVVWQAGLLAEQWRSEYRLGIFLRAKDRDDATLAAIEHYAFVNGLRTERIYADRGLPAEITATPAYVYQSAKGRAIYSGRHDAPEAIEQFIRRSQTAPKKMVADLKQNVLVARNGRQQIALSLKLTTPSGTDAPEQFPAGVREAILSGLAGASGFTPTESTALNALDRRIYLDLHPYRNPDDSYALSYALFSQFNCHEQVHDNFGQPVTVSANGAGGEELVRAITRDLADMRRFEAGFVPRGLSERTPEVSWEALGWSLPKRVIAAQQTEAYTEPLAVSGHYRTELSETDAPGLFFSFPSPLDRYSGEVRELTVDFRFGPNGTSLSGRVDLPVTSISTGSGSLDTYVLGDILKSRKHPTASLVFDEVTVDGNWFSGQEKQLSIPASLTVRGKSYPVEIKAGLTADDNGNLRVSADFELDFRAVFGNPGPDGPDEIRRRLGFSAVFDMTQNHGK